MNWWRLFWGVIEKVIAFFRRWRASPSITPAIDTLARTAWGEARGEGVAGMQGVCCIAVNRAHEPGWWGTDIMSVCRKPFQFSCWNPNDPNYPKLMVVTAEDPEFKVALMLATEAANGTLSDITKGADHYHEESIMPSWAEGKTPTAKIGHQIFYKLGLSA